MRGWPTALAVAAALASLSCGAHANPEDRDLFERVCSGCHSLEVPLGKNKNLKGWRRTVESMRERGARLNEQEVERIARYLAGVRPRS